MRHLELHIVDEHASEVMRLARRFDAFSPAIVPLAEQGGRRKSMVSLTLPNDAVGDFIAAVAKVSDDVAVVLLPRGALAIQLPLDRVHDQVREVGVRSALELVLGALQSLGSWKGMLMYALFSGAVAAYGVIFDTAYLLVAAMLIAPIGAPAMVCAVGATVGDWRIMAKGALRFWCALAVLSATSLALGLVYRLDFSTATMEQISSLSRWALLIAVLGGAAGAQAQIQDERDSLVTGTATGFLVAVALSPPAAVLGLSIALQRWDYSVQMLFTLALTFFGVIAGGWLSLTIFGVRATSVTAGRGSRTARYAALGLSVVAALSLLSVQLLPSPQLRKADLSRAAVSVVQDAFRGIPEAQLVQASAEFTRRDLRLMGGEALLLDVVVRATAGPPDASMDSEIRRRVEGAVRARLSGVSPLTRLTILPP